MADVAATGMRRYEIRLKAVEAMTLFTIAIDDCECWLESSCISIPSHDHIGLDCGVA